MKSFEEALAWLYGTQLFGVKLGLDSMERLAAELGIGLSGPHEFSERLSNRSTEGGGLGSVPGGAELSGNPIVSSSFPKIIHVAGTNGKGSTCALMASVCQEAGLRTGLYTSPHLICFRERIQINGELIPEEAALEGLRKIRALVSDWNPHPTFFEIVTALALDWFQRNGVEVAIIETGLGGRLDATNVVIPVVSVLTSIGMDHAQILGGTLSAIATEKAGIIKGKVPVVTAPQEPEVAEVIRTVAEKRGAILTTVTAPWSEGEIGLLGETQRWNAALAIAALEAGGFWFPIKVQRAGLANVEWPCRFQCINDTLILDGAHNAPAAQVLVSTWIEVFPGEKATLIFGALADKDVGSVLRVLEPIIGEMILVPVFSPRALEPGILLETVKKTLPDIPCHIGASLDVVLAQRSRFRRLVTGSLYLVGDALGLIRGQKTEWSAQ